MPTLPRVIAHFVPPTPMSRRLALQSMLSRTGEGAFNTVSAVFLLKVVGISAGSVGIAITLALVARSIAAYPAGRIVDLLGPKRVWWVAEGTLALLFLGMPWIGSFAAYVVFAIAFEVVQAAGESANRAYVLDVLPTDERVETQAFIYSALNIGFTIGALIGGVALAFDSREVVRWLPWLSTLLLAVNSTFISRLPDAAHDLRVADRSTPRERVPGPSASRNVGWIATSALVSTMWTNQVLLNTVIPLWLVARTDAPPVLLAWLFGTNTVLCIFLPPYLAKMGRTLAAAIRAVWVSAGFFVVSCLITMVTHSTTGLVTVLLVWLGHVTVTGAELAITGATWSVQAELMDPRRRGEYDGVANVARGLGSMWAPALYTWLAMDLHDGLGWLVIAAIILLATSAFRPSVAAATRFRDRHFPAEVPVS